MKTSTEIKGFKKKMMGKLETQAEAVFRRRLEAGGYEFKRQMVLGFYILDFVLQKKMAVVEIDGGSHIPRRAYDASRDQFCRMLGYAVFRVPNAYVDRFDFSTLDALPEKTVAEFRHSLGRANGLRSKAIQELRAQGGVYAGR